MTENDLEKLLRSTKVGSAARVEPPDGFAQRVFAKHLEQQRQGQMLFQTALFSVAAACCIFISIVGLNFDHLTSSAADETDPVVEMANSVWDSAGN
jgi:hypothetical protein